MAVEADLSSTPIPPSLPLLWLALPCCAPSDVVEYIITVHALEHRVLRRMPRVAARGVLVAAVWVWLPSLSSTQLVCVRASCLCGPRLCSPHMQDHFEEAAEREAFYRNIHRPLKLWYNKKGAELTDVFGAFPQFWQVRAWLCL